MTPVLARSAVATLVVVALSLPQINCATIVRGTSQDVAVSTSPPGATVTVEDENRGVTPVTLTLKKKNKYRIVLSKEGYEDVVVNLDKNFKFAPTIIGNIFSWGLIGIIVDLANGSAYQLSPEAIDREFLEGTASLWNVQGREGEIHVILLTAEQYADLRR